MLANHDRDIEFTYATSVENQIRRLIVRTIECVSGQKYLQKLYGDFQRDPHRGDFFDEAVERLNLDVRYDAAKLASAPRDEPVIFIANHPYGVVDGIVLTWLCRKVRPDVKIMANQVLCQASEADGSLLPVDFSSSGNALRTNLETRRVALESLRNGGAVGLFPAGGVAASLNPVKGPATDPEWHPFLEKLVRVSNAKIVPLYFEGQNSRMFQIASHLSYTLRLALFFSETRRSVGAAIDVEIGDPIEPETLSHLPNRKDVTRYLRQKTYALASHHKRNAHGIDGCANQPFIFPSHVKVS